MDQTQKKWSTPQAAVILTVIILASFGRAYFRSKPRRDRQAKVVAMAAEGEKRWAALGRPDGAVTYGEKSVKQNASEILSDVIIKQEFRQAGRFADTADWYRTELAKKGWKLSEPSKDTDDHVSFCRDEWVLELKRTANFEIETPSDHRFELNLWWMNTAAAPCPQRR